MLQSMGSQRVGHDLETEQSDKGIFKEGLNGDLKATQTAGDGQCETVSPGSNFRLFSLF